MDMLALHVHFFKAETRENDTKWQWSGWAAQKWGAVVAVSRRVNECTKWSKQQQHLAECQKPQVAAQSSGKFSWGLLPCRTPQFPRVRQALAQEWGTISWPSCCLDKVDCKIIIVIFQEVALICYLFICKILFAELINFQEEIITSVLLRLILAGI